MSSLFNSEMPSSFCTRTRKSFSSQLAKSSNRKANREAMILPSMTSSPMSSNLPMAANFEGVTVPVIDSVCAWLHAALVPRTQAAPFF